MAVKNPEELETYPCHGPIEPHVRVKLLADGSICAADRGDIDPDWIGVTQSRGVNTGDDVTVRKNFPGVRTCRAWNTFPAGQILYGFSMGKVSSEPSGNAIGRAMTECDNGNMFVEVEFF